MEFESVIAKLRHAFTALREGHGLLSSCNWVLRGLPHTIYLYRNKALMEARPTQCRNLVAKWPNFIGIVDASSFGVG